MTWNHDAVLSRQALNLPTRVLWVGCIGIRVSKDEEEALGDMLLEQHNCVAVFLDEQLQADFYHGFCRGYLRPIFHRLQRLPDAADPFWRRSGARTAR